jgi:hypothetical protein
MSASVLVLGLSAGMVGLIGVTTGQATTSAGDADFVAKNALVDKVGKDCVRKRSSLKDWTSIDAKIAAASENAGWITSQIFVGTLANAKASINATEVSSGGGKTWLLVENGAAQLRAVVARNSGGREAFVVVETVDPIPC